MVPREGPDLGGHPSMIDAGLTPAVACPKDSGGHGAAISLNLSLKVSLSTTKGINVMEQRFQEELFCFYFFLLLLPLVLPL